jgi:hypothetical protein
MKLGKEAQAVRNRIDDLLGSDKIPRREYKAFLEEIAADIECRLDCLREEEGE